MRSKSASASYSLFSSCRVNGVIHHDELVFWSDGQDADSSMKALIKILDGQPGKIKVDHVEHISGALKQIEEIVLDVADVESRLDGDWLGDGKTLLERLERAIEGMLILLTAFNVSDSDLVAIMAKEKMYASEMGETAFEWVVSRSKEVRASISEYEAVDCERKEKMDMLWSKLGPTVGSLPDADRLAFHEGCIHLQFNRLLGLEGNRWEAVAMLGLTLKVPP